MGQIEPPTNFGALVRAFREQRDWTQQELAERWGFTREYVSQIELGKNSASIETLYRVSLGLQIKLADLFHSVEQHWAGQK